ncbi:hypothetical protein A9Z06_00460 [Rhizobium sp. YK2]|nr:hypothetical protein A9Z06_00460 [Rhizobium sp. YK2]
MSAARRIPFEIRFLLVLEVVVEVVFDTVDDIAGLEIISGMNASRAAVEIAVGPCRRVPCRKISQETSRPMRSALFGRPRAQVWLRFEPSCVWLRA